MTGLLVSVRSAAEARLAVDAGALLIDAKEPSRGPLGPTSPKTLAEIVAAVGDRAPVSAALGELLDWTLGSGSTDESEEGGSGLGCARPDALPEGMAFGKLGLAGCRFREDWRDRFAQAAHELLRWGVSPVAVVYADFQRAHAPLPLQVLAAGQAASCRMALLDTCHKDGAGLLDVWTREDLAEFASQARRAEMKIVLAGSLTARTIPRVLEFQPAYVGVRGAVVAEGRREGTLDPIRVRELASLLAGNS